MTALPPYYSKISVKINQIPPGLSDKILLCFLGRMHKEWDTTTKKPTLHNGMSAESLTASVWLCQRLAELPE